MTTPQPTAWTMYVGQSVFVYSRDRAVDHWTGARPGIICSRRIAGYGTVYDVEVFGLRERLVLSDQLVYDEPFELESRSLPRFLVVRAISLDGLLTEVKSITTNPVEVNLSALTVNEIRARQGFKKLVIDLFQEGDFTLASGAKSEWKIECDAITPAQWKALARMAKDFLPKFGSVTGVPRGGVPFAEAMGKYLSPHPSLPANHPRLLVCEDVWTTGNSTRRYVESMVNRGILKRDFQYGDDVIGVCVFARGPVPTWMTPLFAMPPAYGSTANVEVDSSGPQGHPREG